jgi:CubicO group peptidase (beta-lactamase class C family)
MKRGVVMFKYKNQINDLVYKYRLINLGNLFSIIITIILLFIANTSSVSANNPITGEALPGLESLDTAMLQFLDKYKIPGGSLAVAFKGKLILARGYGYATKSPKEMLQVQPQSRFRIASLSKPITAAAIMLLVEDGRLTMDDKIISLLGDDAPKKITDKRMKDLTVRHLLEHRGGLPSNNNNDPMFQSKEPPCPNYLPSFLDRWLESTPGEKYSYSNIGYCILGRIIEKITGKSYEDFVTDRILVPTAAQTFELGSSTKTKFNEVTYYNSPGERVSPYNDFNLEAMKANGGWIGSSVDYLRILTAIGHQRSPVLLKLNTFQEMLAKPQDPSLTDKPVYYAKGFNVQDLKDGGKNIWHDGSLPGTATRAARTDSGYAWVIFFNMRGFPINEIDQAIWTNLKSIKKPPEGDLFYKYEVSNKDGSKASVVKPTPKKKPERVIIENGIIFFPEDDMQDVNIKELRFSFASDTPAEVLAIKGKVYGKKKVEGQKMMYLIPLEFNAGTRKIRLLYVSDNKGTGSKPVRYPVEGTYDGSNDIVLKPAGSKPDQPWASLYMGPEKQRGNLRLDWDVGGSTPFVPVAELP